MKDRNAIIIAEDNGGIEDSTVKYDSRRPVLIVDLETDPKHMQIVETIGGTNYTDSGGVQTRRDVMYEMEHKLGYIPLVDAFFYAKSYGGSETHAKAGLYGSGYIQFNTGSTISDRYSFEVDAERFRLIHEFQEYGFSTGYASDAASYIIRTKFYIYSINSGRVLKYGGYTYS